MRLLGVFWGLGGLPSSAHNWRAAAEKLRAAGHDPQRRGSTALAGWSSSSSQRAPNVPQHVDIAAYAAFGAFYFLVSAIWLQVSDVRRRQDGVRDDLTHCHADHRALGRESGQLLRVGDVCGGGSNRWIQAVEALNGPRPVRGLPRIGKQHKRIYIPLKAHF